MSYKFAVIGDPIVHSLSPAIHNHWLNILDMSGSYDAIRVEPRRLFETLKQLQQNGYTGLNVTLPHKTNVLTSALSLTNRVKTIGAANTLMCRTGEIGWHADNTDAGGFSIAFDRALRKISNAPYKDIVILGAGGSARAIVYALYSRGYRLSILNRTLERADEVSDEITGGEAATAPLDQYREYCADAMIVINTLSLGHAGKYLELGPADNQIFLDISYGAAAETQLSHAQEMGWQTEDGLSMLVAQAGLSFELWTGIAPPFKEGLKAAQSALRSRV